MICSCMYRVLLPRVHAQGGKVIVVVVVVIVSTKIAISQDAGCNHNESIEFGEKLASVCVKSRDTVHEPHK